MIDRWIDPEDEEEIVEIQEDEDLDDISPDMISDAEYDYECKMFKEGRFA